VTSLWNAHHVGGLPCKDVFIGVEEVDERTFLFGSEVGADVHRLVPRVVGVDEDLLYTLRGLKGSNNQLGDGCLLENFLRDAYELLEGNDH
jgi:hypothetical protein